MSLILYSLYLNTELFRCVSMHRRFKLQSNCYLLPFRMNGHFFVHLNFQSWQWCMHMHTVWHPHLTVDKDILQFYTACLRWWLFPHCIFRIRKYLKQPNKTPDFLLSKLGWSHTVLVATTANKATQNWTTKRDALAIEGAQEVWMDAMHTS